jgi:asparagine N-glycosylation enzyme membrane subunit Stt3
MAEEKLASERLKQIGLFLKNKYSWLSYVLLAAVVYLAIWIRTRGLLGLKDVTTGTWTLGPDLDPFLFLRWAKYIVAHGHLMSIDTFRNAPLGVSTHFDFLAHSYFIAWFHYIAQFFGSTSVTESAVLYPVFIFALGVIFVFLFVRKVFVDSMGAPAANALGIISAFFTTVIPVLLPRTIAGIPDKQGTFVFFLFLSLYLFICAWKAKTLRNQLILAISAGIATGIFYIVWGGASITSIVVAPAVLLFFLIGNLDKNKVYTYLLWLVIPPAFLLYFSSRYTFTTLLMSFYIAMPVFIGLLISFHYLLYEPYLKHKIHYFPKIPDRAKSIILVFLGVFIVGLALFGPNYIFGMIITILSLLISPAPTDRFNLTVAQNRVPYLSDLIGSFGFTVSGIPVFFIIFLLGAIYLTYKTVEGFEKKERWTITLSFAFMLFAMLYSRYSSTSVLNGDSFQSHLFYALGLLTFASSVIYACWKSYKSGNSAVFKTINFGYLASLILFFLTLVSVKGAVRLVLLLVPPASIMAAFLVVSLVISITKSPQGTSKSVKMILALVTIIVLIYAGYTFTQSSISLAQNYVPTIYTQQWQYAMQWVRDSTPQDAVFGHWWDYGYWLQSIGNRATVLDGGNVYTYWDFLMGRYALTGTSNKEALDFLYAHNTTYFLIDSTDIGKYPAFASIGSDQNYDRLSSIPTMIEYDQLTQQTKNDTVLSYIFGISGSQLSGQALDSDIYYNSNGTQVNLFQGKAAMAKISIPFNSSGVIDGQPMAMFFDSLGQYNLPLRYAYVANHLYDFGTGIDAGVYVMPVISQNGLTPYHAVLYLGPKTVHSQFTRLYLFKENNPNFILAHSQDDLLVSTLKSQNYTNEDIIFDETNYANARGNNVAGPIRIWKINYPAGMVVNQTYLLTTYPNPALQRSQ